MSTGDVSAHINHVCKTSFYALYRIGKLRTFLDNACIEKLVNAFISSRLEIQKLQSVQNAVARLITHNKKYDHITPILIYLLYNTGFLLKKEFLKIYF